MSKKAEENVPYLRDNGSWVTNKTITLGGAANFDMSGSTGTFSPPSGGSAASTISSASANALAVGPNGTTNPSLNVDASTASAATGINIKSAAANSGLAISILSSQASENVTFDAKGSGTIKLGGTSTGNILLGQSMSITGGAVNNLNTGAGTITVTSGSANALIVGPNGVTNPSFNVDASTASAVAGLNIKAAATGGTVAVTTTDSGSNTSLSIAAKGAGTLNLNPAVVATAGGAANDGIQYGSLNVGLYTGTGAPTFSAMNGSIYTDSNATTTTTRIYVNKSGAGTAGTTWTNLTTAA